MKTQDPTWSYKVFTGKCLTGAFATNCPWEEDRRRGEPPVSVYCGAQRNLEKRKQNPFLLQRLSRTLYWHLNDLVPFSWSRQKAQFWRWEAVRCNWQAPKVLRAVPAVQQVLKGDERSFFQSHAHTRVQPWGHLCGTLNCHLGSY